MDKNKFVRWYLGFSVIFALFMYYMQNRFINALFGEGTEFFGDIESSLFNVNFSNYFADISTFNAPLVIYLSFLLLTLLVAYFALKEEKVEKKLIQDVVFYNVLLAATFVGFNILFMILIPDRVDGAFTNGFFTSILTQSGGVERTLYNFVKPLLLVYTVLNVVVLFVAREKKFKSKQKVEELDSEFLRQ